MPICSAMYTNPVNLDPLKFYTTLTVKYIANTVDMTCGDYLKSRDQSMFHEFKFRFYILQIKYK